jgi:hypothetical protein
MLSSFRRFLANARNHFWKVTSWRLNSSAECQRESVTTTRRSPLRRSPLRNTAASSRTEQPSSVRLPATRRQNRSPPELHQADVTAAETLPDVVAARHGRRPSPASSHRRSRAHPADVPGSASLYAAVCDAPFDRRCEDLVNNGRKRGLLRWPRLLQPISRRLGVPQHLGQSLPVNSRLTARRPFTQFARQYPAANFSPKFHVGDHPAQLLPPD